MNTVIWKGKRIFPSKLVCIGRNYVEHIEELGNEIPEEMVVFLKPNSAISQALRSHHGEQLHYEGELCFLIEKGQFAAVGVGLDLTKRDLQNRLKSKGLPWERAKAFDGAALFSDFVTLPNEPHGLSFDLDINGVSVQHGDVALMIHKPEKILPKLKGFLTLCDGDIVMTGTPKGVGMVNPGDVFKARVWAGKQELGRVSWTAS